MKNLLWWEKYRPKKLEDIVLLPRIKNLFKEGDLVGNYIFYGNYGSGKTSLARILIGKYSKDKPFLEINSSLYTSIDILRSDIENFCKFTPIMETESSIKYVFLDEFERVSTQFQDAFKAFIEKYSSNVRFIITTNHIGKISDGIKSRIPQINFDCLNLEEEKYLKQQMFLRIKNVILKKEEKKVEKKILVDLINNSFPDFRSIIVSLQEYFFNDSIILSDTNSLTRQNDLYEFIFNKDTNYENIFHFLMNNFGSDKIDIMFQMLGKPFIEWCIKNNIDNSKLFSANYILSDYSSKLEQVVDPLILGMTVIGKYKDLFN
jgi:DNA polymerase III delta prime subunit